MQESKSCALPLGDSPMSTKLVPWDNPGIGWIEGLEPSASRATIWRASQLRHTHHKIIEIKSQTCSKGFEPPTHGLEGRCSIQLSYRHIPLFATEKRVMGIEPTYPAWKAGVLPLNYTRRTELRCEIGVTGFEPATPWSQTRCSSQAEPHPAGLTLAPHTTQDILYSIDKGLSTNFFHFFAEILERGIAKSEDHYI